MKRKDDFVTNSSSCAFIFIGWKLEENMDNAMRIADLYNVDTKNIDNTEDVLQEVGEQGVDIYFGDHSEDGFESNHIYIGKIKDIDTDDPYDVGMDQGITENFETKLIDEFGADKVRIVVGMRLC
mgnify:CR=1 FL=1